MKCDCASQRVERGRLERRLDRKDRARQRTGQAGKQEIAGCHRDIPPAGLGQGPAQLSRRERHFVRLELREASADARAEDKRAIGIEEVRLDEREAAALIAQRVQGAQHVVEAQDQVMKDAVAEHQIELPEPSDVVAKQIQLFEPEVGQGVRSPCARQETVADIDGHDLGADPGGHAGRCFPGSTAQFENPVRPKSSGFGDEPAIAPARPERRRPDRLENLVEAALVL